MLNRTRRPRRQARLKGQTFTRLVPHIVTVAALCAGLTAIRFAVTGKWEYSVLAIVIAAVLDALDGTIARLLKSASDFGAELDSLSDVVAFGVAPAMVIYFWSLSEGGGMAWAAALFFAVCCALRLARFNSTLGARPPYAYNYFTGVPAPAGALLALAPIVLSFEIGNLFIVDHPGLVGGWLVLVALLMVSHLPTYSLKQVKVPQRHVVPLLAGFGLLVAGFAGAPWRTLLVCGAVYVLSFPFSLRSYRRLRREAARLHDAKSKDGKGDDSDDDTDAGGTRPVHLRPV